MSLGKLGEDLAWRHYQQLGFKLLERNYIFRRGIQAGEIDLIVSRDKLIVFVEVKSRTNSKFGNAFEAVNRSKQIKLIRTMHLYLRSHPQFQDFSYQLDVAGVDVDPVRSGASNGVDNSNEPVIIIPNAIEDLD